MRRTERAEAIPLAEDGLRIHVGRGMLPAGVEARLEIRRLVRWRGPLPNCDALGGAVIPTFLAGVWRAVQPFRG